MNQISRVLPSYFRCAASIALGLLGQAAVAQTLDEQYEFYLDARCNNLGFDRDGAFNVLPGQAGPNLSAYCSGFFVPPPPPPPGTTISTSATGGASGAANGRGITEDDTLRRRREQLRNEETATPGADVELITGGALGVFLTFDYQRAEQDVTRYEAGSDSDLQGIALGMDYRLGTTGVIGLALNSRDLRGDFAGDGGEFERDSQAVTLYGSWFPRDGMFIDASAGIENIDQRSQRIVGRRIRTVVDGDETVTFDIPLAPANGSTDGEITTLELRGGYDVLVADFTLGPRVAVVQQRSTLDGYAETGVTPMTLSFDEQTDKSLRGSLGLQGSRAFGLSKGVLVLQLNVDWLHEFQDDQQTLTARFAEDLRPDAPRLRFLNQPPDRDWANLRASAVAVLADGFSGFLSVERTFGHEYLDQYGVSVGGRWEF